MGIVEYVFVVSGGETMGSDSLRDGSRVFAQDTCKCERVTINCAKVNATGITIVGISILVARCWMSFEMTSGGLRGRMRQ